MHAQLRSAITLTTLIWKRSIVLQHWQHKIHQPRKLSTVGTSGNEAELMFMFMVMHNLTR